MSPLEKVMSKLNPARVTAISQVKVVAVRGVVPGWMDSRAQGRKESVRFSQFHAGNLVQAISQRSLEMTGNYSLVLKFLIYKYTKISQVF